MDRLALLPASYPQTSPDQNSARVGNLLYKCQSGHGDFFSSDVVSEMYLFKIINLFNYRVGKDWGKMRAEMPHLIYQHNSVKKTGGRG